MPDKTFYESRASIFKALGHPDRLLMADLLRERPMCVSELQQKVGSDISVVSKHLSVLKACGIVRSEKKGNLVLYELVLPCLGTFLDCLCSCCCKVPRSRPLPRTQ